MRRISLAFVLAFTGFFSFPQAADLSIQGSVGALQSITVTPTGNATALNLNADVTDLPVATSVEKSNAIAGYTVTVSSANAVAANQAPFLKGANVGNNDKVTYTLKYGGTAVPFVNGSATVTTASTRTGSSGVSKSITISYSTSTANLKNDTYSDQLTLTLISN